VVTGSAFAEKKLNLLGKFSNIMWEIVFSLTAFDDD
jgi:hypothetical protein